MLDTAEIRARISISRDARGPPFPGAPSVSFARKRESISSKFRHGGARPNSGGPRENSGGARAGAGRPRKPEPLCQSLSPDLYRWCAYQTHPQAERHAAEDLTRSGYDCYAPLIAMRKQDPVIRSMFHTVRVARFPGYGFVKLGPGEPWQPIVEANGVARILRGHDGRPERIPVGEIERHMLDDDRLCDLQPEAMPVFGVGARVLVLAASLAGYEGLVLEDDGFVTLVEVQMFGRPMRVRCHRESVEAV